MSKKFGDDRSRDKDLDTEIDMEEMDNLNMDDSFGRGGVEDGGGRSPAKATGRMMVETAKGMAEGAMGAVEEEVERNMPNVMTIKSELSDSYQDLKDVKDEISKQLQPMMNSMENATRKILPRVQKVMPKSWYDKLKGALDDRAAARAGSASPSKEQERQDLISSELSQLFSEQLEINKHNEFEANKTRLMDRAISSTQHKASQHALARIYDSARSTEIFHRTLHTAYMKKSLELKYKHLFVAQDTHNLLAKSMASFEEYLKGIVKNTSLPDVMKTQASDYIKQQRTQRYGMLMSDYLTNARKMIFTKIKNSLKDVVSGMGMGAGGLEMMAEGLDMADSMGDMGGPSGNDMIARMGGGFLGKALAAGPVRAIFDKIAPYTNTINNRLDNVKTRAYMGMDKLRSDWASSTNPLKSFIASFLPSMAPSTTASNDLLTKSEEAATFDKLTRQSIVEIIPGFLGKILHSVDKLSKPDAEEMVYNIYKRDFTTVSEFQEDVNKDTRMFGSSGTQTAAIGRALGALKKGNELKNPNVNGMEKLEGLEDALSQFIANHSGYYLHFEPETLGAYRMNPDKLIQESAYINKVSENIDTEEFNRLVDAILDGITGQDGKFDQDLLREFANAIHDTRQTVDGAKERLPWLTENIGGRRFLKHIVRDDGSINQRFLNKQLSRHDGIKSIRGNVDYNSMRLDDVIKDRTIVDETVAEKMSDFRNSAIGKPIMSGIGWVKDKFDAKEEQDDGTVIGPDGEKVEVDIGHISTTTREILGNQFIRSARFVANRSELDAEQVKRLISDANKRFEVLNSEGISDQMKKQLSIRIVADLIRAHSIYPVIKNANGWISRLVSGVKSKGKDVGPETKASEEKAKGKKPEEKKTFLGRLRGIKDALVGEAKETKAESEAEKNEAKTEHDAPTGVDFLSQEEADKEAPKLAEKMSKKKFKLPTTKQGVEKMVDKFTEDLVNLVHASPKNRQEAIKAYRDLRDKIAKDHPEIASRMDSSVRIFSDYAQKITDTIKKNELFQFGVASAEVVNERLIAPTVEKAKNKLNEAQKAVVKKLLDYSEDQLKAVGLTRHDIEDALNGDDWAQARIKNALPAIEAYLKQTAKEKITGAYTSAKETISGWGSSLKAQAKDIFGGGGGIGPDKGVGKLYGLVKAWSKAVNAEHNVIVDHISEVLKQLRIGVPALTGKQAEAVTKTVTEVNTINAQQRKRYGMFGRGGAALTAASGAIIKAAWSGAEWAGGIYGKTYSAAVGALGSAATGVIGGIKRFGGWFANTAGLNPYVDIYVKGQEDKKPILTWKKQAFGKGVCYRNEDGSIGERVKSSPDIVKNGKEIVDPETGNILITFEDLEKGLWAANGPFTQVGRIATAAVRGTLGIYGNAVKGLGAIGKVVAEGLFGKAGVAQEKLCDVYVKGKMKNGPVVTRRQLEKGLVVFANGEKVTQVSDIHEPVYLFDPSDPDNKECLIDERMIKKGLCDVDGKPLGTREGTGAKEGLIGKAFNLGGTIAKGIFGETGMKLVGGALAGLGSIYKGLFDALLGGASSIGRGMANIGARIFGFDTPNGFGRKAFNGLNSRLDKLIELVANIAANGGGGGGGGGSPDRGRRGYWDKDGKFHPRKNGSSYENDGPDKPGGAKTKANAEGKVNVDAKANYVHTNFGDKDGDGVNDWEEKEEGEGGGIDMMDALMMSPWVPKGIKKKIAKAKTSVTKKLKGIKKKIAKAKTSVTKKLKGVKKSATKNAKNILKATKKGGIKGGIKAAGKAGRSATKAVKAAKAVKGASSAVKAARLARGGKFGLLGKAIGLGGKAAAPLAFLMAGADAAEARNNAEEILGRKDVSESSKDIVASSAAMDSMSSGALLGLDHLILGKNINNWLGEKLYGDENAGAQARDEIDKELGIDKYNINTNLRGKLAKDAAWYNPLVWGANAVDGVTGVANDLGKGAIRVVGGGGKALWMNAKQWWNGRKEEEEQNKKLANAQAVARSYDEIVAGCVPKGIDLGGAKPRDLFNKFLRKQKISRAERDEAVKKYGNVFSDPGLQAKFSKWLKDTFPPDESDPKGRLKFFRGIMNQSREARAKVDPLILKIFGIENPHADNEWENKLFYLEKAVHDTEGKEGVGDTAAKAASTAAAESRVSDVASKPAAEKAAAAKSPTKPAAPKSMEEKAAEQRTIKQATGKNSVYEVIDEFVASIGVDMVKTMNLTEFKSKLRSYIEEKLKKAGVPVVSWKSIISTANNHARFAYAKCFGIEDPGKVSFDVDRLINPETGEPFELLKPEEIRAGKQTSETMSKTGVTDTSQLYPIKPVDIIKPEELTLASGMVQKNQLSKVSAAIKSQPAPQLDLLAEQRNQFKEMMEEMHPWMKAMGDLSHAIGKEGLKVEGIDTLAAITAAKPSGTTQVINNNTIVNDADSGLDLRKKQY